MKVGKREKGKIYAYRTIQSPGYRDHVNIYVGKTDYRQAWFCYRTFVKYTGIKLKPGQMIEIEVRAKGGVEDDNNI